MRLIGVFALQLVALLLLSLTAFGQFFGNDPRLEWKMIETDHFIIVFHTGLEETAQEAATMAEDAYEYWEGNLDYHVEGKTKIILVDNSDLDGGAASSTFQIIGITPTAARTFNEWLNSRNDPLEEVLYHEHGHVVDLSKVSGISAELRKIFGRAVRPTAMKPGSFTEGIPIYLELLRSGHSRANDPRDAMYFRQMVVEERFIPFDQILYSYERTAWPSLYMITHDIGPWVVRYLGEVYGPSAIERIDRVIAEHPLALSAFLNSVFGSLLDIPISPIAPNFGWVLERTLGISAEEFYEGFKAWLKEMFADQIEKIKQAGVTPSQKISPLGYWNNKPAWSPKGDWIAYFHSDPERGSQLRLVRPDGREDRAIVAIEPGFSFFRPHFWSPVPAWSPDGSLIAYATVDKHDHYYLRSDLYLYHLTTGKTQRLTHGERAYRPVFAPDGKKLIYARYEWGGKAPDLYGMDLATGERKLLQELPEETLLDSFSLSPDGSQLALSLWRYGGYQDIYLLPASGGELTSITADQATDLDPAWTPDGQYIVFNSDRDGVDNLYAYRLSDGQFFKVTNMLSGAFHPNLSPDQKQIVFVSYSTSGYEIHGMILDSSQWTSIPAPEKAEFPQKPKVQFAWPMKPYDPRVTLAPPGWTPIVGKDSIGVALTGLDALFQQFYSLRAGYDFEHQMPFYSLTYETEHLLPPLSWSFNAGGGPSGEHQGVGVSYPLVQSWAMEQQLSLGVSRREFMGVSHTLSASWSLDHLWGLDLMKNELNVEIEGKLAHLAHIVGADRWEKQLLIAIDDMIRLPTERTQRLELQLTIGLSDHEAFRLGGEQGRFSLRGYPRGVVQGAQAVVAHLEYESPLYHILRAPRNWPLFLEGVWGRAFVDAGIAPSDQLDFNWDGIKIGIGTELELRFTFAYFARAILRVGLAKGLDRAEPVFYFHAGPAF